MTDIQPPLNKPTDQQMADWEEWSEKELLVAIVLRINGIAGLLVNMANSMPEFLEMVKNPMIQGAFKLMLKRAKRG